MGRIVPKFGMMDLNVSSLNRGKITNGRGLVQPFGGVRAYS